jgi:hypothetical protein
MTSRQQRSTRKANVVGAAALVLALGGGVNGSEPTGPGATTIEQNKATVRRWSEELWGRGNLAVADEIIAADYIRHDPGDPFPGPRSRRRQADRHDAAVDAARLQDRGRGDHRGG